MKKVKIGYKKSIWVVSVLLFYWLEGVWFLIDSLVHERLTIEKITLKL